MKKQLCTPVSLTNAATGKRVRVSSLPVGSALVPVPTCTPQPILAYWHRAAGALTVYVAGTMPYELRTAAEAGRTDEEVQLLDELPAGIEEVDLTDCRQNYHLLLPQAA
jgi:hypothetical protein